MSEPNDTPDLADRVRDATRSAAETIEDVPLLRLDPPRARWAWRVPLAAAAAVVVAIGAGVALGRPREPGASPAGPLAASPARPAPTPKPSKPTGTTQPAETDTARFVAIASPRAVTIRAADDGTQRSRLTLPANGGTLIGVRATSSGRLFYALARHGECGARIYRLTLNADGRLSSAIVLPFAPPERYDVTSFAVSGDGGTLAYGLTVCGGTAGAIATTDIATGRGRLWRSARPVPVLNVSITADGRTIAYQRAETVRPRETVTAREPASSPSHGRMYATPRAQEEPPSAVPSPAGKSPERPRPSPSVPSSARRPAPAVTRTIQVTPVPSVRPTVADRGLRARDVATDPVVFLLDTKTDRTLDDSRPVKLRADRPAGRDALRGVVIAPDGAGLYAAMPDAGEPADGGGPPGSVIEEFAVADGGRLRTFYRDRGAVLTLVSGDGSGERLIVRRDREFGAVGPDGYRPLAKVGIAGPIDLAW